MIYVLSECNGLWDNLEKSEQPMLKGEVKKEFMMEKEGKKEYDRRNNERDESSHEKFPKSIVDFADSVSWQCLRSRFIKKNIKAIATAA